jgi:hypothetical protein
MELNSSGIWICHNKGLFAIKQIKRAILRSFGTG